MMLSTYLRGSLRLREGAHAQRESPSLEGGPPWPWLPGRGCSPRFPKCPFDLSVNKCEMSC